MADLRAFRGFRYDLGRVGSLAGVICPPYDVIDSALQRTLYENSPYNSVRIELTQDQPGDGEIENKYTRAARSLNEWQLANVLKQDSARSMYAYEQEFAVEGQTFIRRGFMARVRLEPFGTGRIFPHEQTLSGPKADRLKLYQATAFNISPVFGLYPDEDGDVFAKIEPLIRNAPPTTATDHLGVINRFWPITDSSLLSQLIGAMGPRPVFIADGHHRYETGLKYLEEQKAAGRVPDDEAPANFCLMMLVGMSDPGLRILPTHRLISLVKNIDFRTLKTVLNEHFEILAEFDSAAACWEHVQLEDTQRVLGFGTPSDGMWLAVRLKDSAIMEQLAPEQSPEWRALAVSILHKLVLEKLLPESIGGTPACTYVHLLKEVTDATEAKACQLVCLVPPCTMQDVEEIAGHREKMPPKSTYFYPKILTGMVFHSLKKD